MRTVSLSELQSRVATILTTNESEMPTDKFQQLIVDGCRFYGASLHLQSLVDHKPAIRISLKASKSFADDYLVGKHGVPSYWAHSAMNMTTHFNLPAVDMSQADLSEFAAQPFYIYYQSLNNLPTAEFAHV